MGAAEIIKRMNDAGKALINAKGEPQFYDVDGTFGWLIHIPRDRYVLRRIVGARALVSPVTGKKDDDSGLIFLPQWIARRQEWAYGGAAVSPTACAGWGWRYLGPIHSHAEVAALVKAVEGLDHFSWSAVSTDTPEARVYLQSLIDAMRKAAAPFKETTNG